MSAVQFSYPTLPDVERLSNGRPVFGADVGALANALNHLAGYRLRQVIQHPVEVDASAVQTYDGNGYAPASPTGVSHTVRVYYYASLNAEHLYLAIMYQADDEGTEPTIVAELQDLTGATLHDVGVQWRRDNGTLIGTDGLMLLATTTVRTEDALAVEASPSGLRMLYVPPAARGTECQIVVTTTNCRVTWVTAAEFPEDEV